ncbi:MAG: hypothetical protein WD733_11150 [Bryobacterales bacterium]
MKVWLLFVVSLSLAWAASPVGLMTVSGPVRISGSDFQPKAVSSWPVLDGDEIVTEPESRAVLVSPKAGRLEIRQDSRVTASEDTVELHTGEVGAERFVVRTGSYTAHPRPDASGRSWFVVSSRNGLPVFAAHRGDLLVNQGEPNPMLVRAGTYAVPAAPALPGGAPPAPPPAGSTAAAAPQYPPGPQQSATLPGTPSASAGASTGWTVGSLGHASSVALVSGLTAAATAGTITGVALIEPSRLRDRSPSSPK